MQRCSGLTDLRFDCLYNIELFVHVVKESAHTLESLRVQFYHTQPMKFLVYDDKDQPIVYSRLKKLVVYGRYRSTFEKKISVDDSVVPFPELRYLSWWSEYPFADDTLFRGNRRSLECLDITFTPHLVDVWQKHKVFFRGRHPRLSVLKLRKDNRSALRNANDNVQCLKSAFNLISPESQTLAVPFPYACQHIFCVMPATFYVRNIRSLHLDNSRFTLLEMLSLVKRLPNMESLECLPGNIDDEINVGRNVAFVDDLYKEYYPLSNRFKHWISKKVYAEFVRPAALTSIALAILSPRYTSTRLAHFDREKYQREIKCAIDCGLYDKHIAKLERLYKRI
ncbi:hypothetical protein LPJ81_002329 [Coemansia sp. IMI 209127]|nr:hypothetical protein LPJ81_002329 [Coemansia sp. IMI 209127]